MRPTAILLLHCPDKQGIITEITKISTYAKNQFYRVGIYLFYLSHPFIRGNSSALPTVPLFSSVNQVGGGD